VEEFPSFLPLAVQFGLYHYVLEKTNELHWNRGLLGDVWNGSGYGKQHRPLLSYAATPWRRDRQHPSIRMNGSLIELGMEGGGAEALVLYPINPKVVSLLLELGSAPITWEQGSAPIPWRGVFTDKAHLPIDLWEVLPWEFKMNYFRCIELLVRAAGYPDHLKRITEGAFKDTFPEEVAVLKEERATVPARPKQIIQSHLEVESNTSRPKGFRKWVKKNQAQCLVRRSSVQKKESGCGIQGCSVSI